jgi:hypothetical protein
MRGWVCLLYMLLITRYCRSLINPRLDIQKTCRCLYCCRLCLATAVYQRRVYRCCHATLAGRSVYRCCHTMVGSACYVTAGGRECLPSGVYWWKEWGYVTSPRESTEFTRPPPPVTPFMSQYSIVTDN